MTLTAPRGQAWHQLPEREALKGQPGNATCFFLTDALRAPIPLSLPIGLAAALPSASGGSPLGCGNVGISASQESCGEAATGHGILFSHCKSR